VALIMVVNTCNIDLVQVLKLQMFYCASCFVTNVFKVLYTVTASLYSMISAASEEL